MVKSSRVIGKRAVYELLGEAHTSYKLSLERRVYSMLDLMSPQLEYNMSDEQARKIEEFLKKKRIEAGYARQEDAARDIGVSQDLISRLESRFSPNIRVGEFGRVLRAYNVPPNDAYELIGLYIPMEPDTEKKEYMRKELIPLMARFDLPGLRTVKRVIESLLLPGK